MDATGKTNLDAPMVPTLINEVWISQEQHCTPRSEYRTHSRTKLIAFERFESDVTVWENASLEPRIALKGIRATPLDSAGGQGSGGKLPKNASDHFVKYYEWVKQLESWILEDKIALVPRSEWQRYRSDSDLKENLYKSIDAHNANGKLALRMRKSIVSVLRGEVDPLELMFGQDDLLDHVYGDITHLNDLPALQRAYLDVVDANSTNLNILELGAGTGSSTAGVLQSLAPLPTSGDDVRWSIARYTFTDISAAFFEKARDKFKAHQDIMEHKVFDGEKDPADQCLALGIYDYVVAQNVVHATHDLKKTLSHLRSLLKPDGQLLLQEGVRQDYFWSGIAFGQLPGWWMGIEPSRKWSPWIPSAEWNDVLKASGFSGADLEMPDGNDEELHIQSLFIASNKLEQANTDAAWDDVILLADPPSVSETAALVQSLKSELELLVAPKPVPIFSVDELDHVELTRSLCIVLAELEDTIRLWEQGVARPAVPTKIMPMFQVQEGLSILQGGKGAGKMIFVPSPEDQIPIVPAQPVPYRFRQDATYVLSGGLGGIGRSTARWMASRGARNLVFLSSSGRITEAVSKMQSDLEAEGCRAHIFKCEVSDAEQLRPVVEGVASSLAPIKGLIQGAMHLKDSMFENMLWEDYQIAVKPKVQGSWNLHQVLPKDLDFFVMLSSATGMLGNRAQANYAAGNVFQDQLAYHRRSLGLPASTLDFGTVLSVGYVAENKGRVAVARHAGITLELTREEEVHALVELLIDPRNDPPPQLVAGLTTMDTYRSRGVPPPTYLSYPLFTHVAAISAQRASSGQGSNGPRIEALLNNAKTIDEAATVVRTAILAKLSSLLSISTEDIHPERSVSSNGVDSVVAMEFRTFLAREVKADIPVLDIMGMWSISCTKQEDRQRE
ncbi:polyketide synthase [Teratosphaeria destructans]|uniref:Polyketide synthase n=1 Tax=Teratosphaeria destructans TaxID=418781 RepID=A0A9W7W2E5_9PEZI|nr:polyketide synthase [Teratosphaeria destructans]